MSKGKGQTQQQPTTTTNNQQPNGRSLSLLFSFPFPIWVPPTCGCVAPCYYQLPATSYQRAMQVGVCSRHPPAPHASLRPVEAVQPLLTYLPSKRRVAAPVPRLISQQTIDMQRLKSSSALRTKRPRSNGQWRRSKSERVSALKR